MRARKIPGQHVAARDFQNSDVKETSRYQLNQKTTCLLDVASEWPSASSCVSSYACAYGAS
jgi:hypothetical protein